MAKPKYSKWLTKDGLSKLEMWARDGLTDKQIAQKMNINVSTLYKWEKEHNEISESLKRGKNLFDNQVEKTLFEKAIGKSVTTTTTYKMVKVDREVLKAKRLRFLNKYKLNHPDLTKEELTLIAIEKVPTYEKIPQIRVINELPPDTTALIFWLKNRQPEKWRDTKEINADVNAKINNPFKELTTEELRKLAKEDD